MAGRVRWLSESDWSMSISILVKLYYWLVVCDSLANHIATYALPYQQNFTNASYKSYEQLGIYQAEFYKRIL